jgi:imidazole glycerol-phosphate synthase subunit HisH
VSLAIVDLGYGNIGSIVRAFARLGAAPRLTADPAALAAASRVVLPGVGAAGYAMERIRALGLADPLRALTAPVLGICLGMQLLFDRSEEEDTDCLGIVPGTVRRLVPAPGLPVPHMGWSRLELRAEGLGLEDRDFVYFAHSFAAPGEGPHVLAAATHGAPIAAIVGRANFLGAQFHPERSGEAGSAFLKVFLER